MIDAVEVGFDNPHTIMKALGAERLVKETSQRHACWETVKIENFKIQCVWKSADNQGKKKLVALLKGSFMELANKMKGHGFTNHINCDIDDIAKAIGHLDSLLPMDIINEGELIFVEYGPNIMMSKPSSQVVPGFMMHRHKKYRDSESIDYNYINLGENRRIKIYDKSEQKQLDCKNLIRTELKAKKKLLTKLGIKHLGDLLEPSSWTKLHAQLVADIESSIIVDETTARLNWTPMQKLLFHQITRPEYYKQLSFETPKKRMKGEAPNLPKKLNAAQKGKKIARAKLRFQKLIKKEGLNKNKTEILKALGEKSGYKIHALENTKSGHKIHDFGKTDENQKTLQNGHKIHTSIDGILSSDQLDQLHSIQQDLHRLTWKGQKVDLKEVKTETELQQKIEILNNKFKDCRRGKIPRLFILMELKKVINKKEEEA